MPLFVMSLQETGVSLPLDSCPSVCVSVFLCLSLSSWLLLLPHVSVISLPHFNGSWPSSVSSVSLFASPLTFECCYQNNRISCEVFPTAFWTLVSTTNGSKQSILMILMRFEVESSFYSRNFLRKICYYWNICSAFSGTSLIIPRKIKCVRRIWQFVSDLHSCHPPKLSLQFKERSVDFSLFFADVCLTLEFLSNFLVIFLSSLCSWLEMSRKSPKVYLNL